MNILIIQILRIGDALQLTPIIKGIRTYFPEARLCLLTSRLGAETFRGEPDVDAIYVLHKEEIAANLVNGSKTHITCALRELAEDLSVVEAQRWDWVINFSYTFATALLAFLLDAKHRSGFYANQQRQYLSKERWFAYSLASFTNRLYSNFNWVDINRHILGLRVLPAPPMRIPKLEPLQRAMLDLREKSCYGRPLVGLHPGASGNYKCWPLEKFAILGRDLAGRHGYKILIFGGPGEKQLAKTLQKEIGDAAYNLAGETDLDALSAYLAQCEVLVTNDTGPMHLAAAIGIPIVGLFFSTHFVETGPYGAGHLVLHPDLECFPCRQTATCIHKKCLDYIDPEQVAALVTCKKDDLTADFEIPGQDAVRAYVSAIDPWGNLEWHPLGKPELRVADAERLALKLVWLSLAAKEEPGADVAAGYLRERLDDFNPPADEAGFDEKMAAWQADLHETGRILAKARQKAIEIQTELIQPAPSRDRLTVLAETLGGLETELEARTGESSTAFLCTLLRQLQESVELGGSRKIAFETISIYQEMHTLADGVLKRAIDIKALLQTSESVLNGRKRAGGAV